MHQIGLFIIWINHTQHVDYKTYYIIGGNKMICLTQRKYSMQQINLNLFEKIHENRIMK